jgi:biopolymer transport protein ExbD
MLSGWLYVSTQLASADAVRREQRRKHRETAAHAMHLDDAPSPADSDPSKLRPFLDDALVALPDHDRTAIILRFFEQRSFVEVGAVLRVTEEAARKRVDRALEKLHATLSRRGITSTATALGLALAASGDGAVPAGLATQISAAAIAHSAATVTASTAATIASLVLPAAAALILGAVTILPLHRANAAAAAELAALTAQNQTLPALRTEAVRLTRALDEARDLSLAAAELPALHARLAALPPPTPPPTSRSVTVTPEGTIQWEGEPVTLTDFLARTRSLQLSSPGGESRLVIRAHGALFSQMAYALDEARKAGIRHIVVETDATPDPLAATSWF